MGIRPEDVSLTPFPKENGVVKLKLEIIEPMGNETILQFICEKNKIACRLQGSIHHLETGSINDVYINICNIHFFDAETGNVLM